MGISSDAIICFGICLPDNNADDTLADMYPDGMWYHEDARCKYPGIEIVTHCHFEYPMYIVAARDQVTVARRGYAQYLGQTLPAVSQEAVDILQKIADDYGIDEKPQWLLCSLMG